MLAFNVRFAVNTNIQIQIWFRLTCESHFVDYWLQS